MSSLKSRLAPETNPGREQIIPNIGAHDQIMFSHEAIVALVAFGHIRYEPEYGPNAKVYRPTNPMADAEMVRSWVDE